jgi:hypothetical protein
MPFRAGWITWCGDDRTFVGAVFTSLACADGTNFKNDKTRQPLNADNHCLFPKRHA